MRRLFHHLLSAPSRAARLALAEKGLAAELVLERPWERREDFLLLDPAGDVPVLVDDDGEVVVGHALLEFLDERYPDVPLLPLGVADRAETRRLVAWFDRKFAVEVTDNLVGEKAWRRLSGAGHPHPPAIRAGLTNIRYHLDYIGWLTERRSWLAGDRLTAADLVAAAHLSAVDFIGDVPWDEHADAKDWYARMKSRPSFRPLLSESLPGFTPPPHYADLDF